MWRGGSHPAAFFVPPGHSPARVELASREISRFRRDGTRQDRTATPDSLPDREPRDHRADDPVHDGCAVLDAQQQQQQQQACHKASAFGTPAPTPPMGSKGSGSEPDATLRSNSSSAPVSAEWLDASSRSARQSRRSPGAFEPALELSRFRSVSWRGTGHAGPLSVRPPPRAA